MKKVAPGRLKEILVAHDKWLESGGTQGRIADLQEADLREADLQGANLQEAILQGAKLKRADLRGADLQGATLQGANLERANLERANLHRANLQEANFEGANLLQADLQNTDLQDTVLREADLQDADLSDAKNLSIKQLAGANISGIVLPTATEKIEELERVKDASKNAKRLFQFMLFGCVYVLLTVATTNDVNLLTNFAFSPLPLIGVSIRLVWFYFAAPILLLGFYGYFHLYLQELWAELSHQPAIFPDGKRLDEKAYPWILNGIVHLHFTLLRNNSPQLSGIKSFISILLAWWTVPITLAILWFSYLTRHDWTVTSFHIILLLISIWLGIRFYLLAAITFRGKKRFKWREAFSGVKSARACIGICAVIMLLVPWYSFKAITGNYSEPWDFLFSWTVVDFEAADVSTKPFNWNGEIKGVKGASLRGRNLQRVKAAHAFLVNADLRETNLKLADFWYADLRGANLQRAELKNAYLNKANLSGADIDWANLNGANLKGASLEGANLKGAYLSGAELGDANLKLANLWKADLSRASLLLANLQGASLVWADLSKVTLEGADLRAANLNGANLKGANLRGAQLAGVDLTNVTGLTKKQIESAYIDHKTKLPDYIKAGAEAAAVVK